MRSFIICFLLLVSAYALWAQSYTFEQITTKADSVLSSRIGSNLMLYCAADYQGSYYSYNKKGKELFAKMNKGASTADHFMSATVRYRFFMTYPQCASMDTISGRIVVNLDTALNQVGDIDLSFLPNFVYKNDSCHFISKDKAIEIALQQNLHLSVAAPYAYIRNTPAGCVWIVLRTIWNEKNTSGTLPTRDDMVIIDAATGEVKEFRVIPYAPHTL